jgi:hypothetical protein
MSHIGREIWSNLQQQVLPNAKRPWCWGLRGWAVGGRVVGGDRDEALAGGSLCVPW